MTPFTINVVYHPDGYPHSVYLRKFGWTQARVKRDLFGNDWAEARREGWRIRMETVTPGESSKGTRVDLLV